MKKNKVGSIFLVSMLAMAGLGISYAGFSDIIYVSGTVDTATVSLIIEDYSGTWLWKVWGPDAPIDEKEIFRGLTTQWTDVTMQAYLLSHYPNSQYEKVSWAYAKAGEATKTVEMIYHNIFPCTEYTADVYVHYTGTIPVYVSIENQLWDEVFNVEDLWTRTFYAEKGVQIGENYVYTPAELPVQLHDCNMLKIELGIHMLQPAFVNNYQGQTYTFSFDIYAEQWYDPC